MSKIKNLLAETDPSLDDLKRPVEQALGTIVYSRTLHRAGLRTWFVKNADYTQGEDDEGHTEYYFENFYDLCEEACAGTLDGLIEDEHLNLSDEVYAATVKYAQDYLADTLADFESECIQDYIMDDKFSLEEMREQTGRC